MEDGLWKRFPPLELPRALALRQALLERLTKADGHINAAGRKLWHESDRGLWSARQAKARMAEVWLWLHGDLDEEPPDLGRSLDRETTAARLAAFARVAHSAPLANAWRAMEQAEAAILTTPFPWLQTPLSDDERARLNAGISRQDAHVASLRACLRVVEDAFAERYVAVASGDWLRLHDGEPGYVLARHGLLIQVFLPAQAWPEPKAAHRAYVLNVARVRPLNKPTPRLIGMPDYYWLCYAFEAYRAAWRHLHAESPPNLYKVIGAAGDATDAATKAWLGRFALGSSTIHFSWTTCQYTEVLHDLAPPEISEALIRHSRRIAAIAHRGTQPSERRSPTWPLEIAVALHAIRPTLETVADRLEPYVDLAPGTRLWLRGARNAMLVARDGRRLALRTAHGTNLAVRLFETFIERVPASPRLEDWHREQRRADWIAAGRRRRRAQGTPRASPGQA